MYLRREQAWGCPCFERNAPTKSQCIHSPTANLLLARLRQLAGCTVTHIVWNGSQIWRGIDAGAEQASYFAVFRAPHISTLRERES